MGSEQWASRLKERVTIEQPSVTTDELGGQEISWESLATVWAQVEPVSLGARESVSASQPQARAGYRVHIRFRDDVNATMRLQWKTHQLAIHSLHEHDSMLEMLAYEEDL